MNHPFPAQEQHARKRKPWIGDLIAAYEKQFPVGSDRQLKRRMVLVSSLIMLLHVGWSLVPLALMGVGACQSDSSSSPFAFLGLIVIWATCGFAFYKSWGRLDYNVDDKISVSRADAPALFEMIDEVSLKLGDGKVDSVIIGESHGAWAVFGRHRRWYGGGRKSYIKLALLTFFSLSERDMKATIAHEAHHLFGDNQSGLAFCYLAYHMAWSARWAPLWIPVRIPIRILERHLVALLCVRSKHCEIGADAFETTVCEPRDCALSLIKFYATGAEGRLAGPETKPGFWLQKESSVKDIYGVRERFIQDLYKERTAFQHRMQKQLKEIVAINDIHPSLESRITSALGIQTDEQLEELIETALQPIDQEATLLLGDSLRRVTDARNEQQWKEWTPTWKAFQEHHQRLQRRLVPAEEVTTLQQAKDHYNVVADTVGEPAALPWLEKAILLSPDDNRAKYLLARYNINHGGVELQRASAQSLHELANCSSFIVSEASLKELSTYYRNIGHHQKLETVGRFQSELETRQYKLHYEKQPDFLGKYLPVELDGVVSFDKCLKLEKWNEVVSAIYVARKQLTQCDETQYFVFALRFHPFRKLTEKSRRKVMAGFAKQIDADMEIQRAPFHVVDRSSWVGLKVCWYGTKLVAPRSRQAEAQDTPSNCRTPSGS